MAKLKVSGGSKELGYTYKLSIEDAVKKANEMMAKMKELNNLAAMGGKPATNDNFRASQLILQNALRNSRLELSELKKQEQELRNTRAQTIADTAELTKKLAENRLEQQELTKAARAAREANKATSGSYKEAQDRLKALGLEIKNTTNGFLGQSPALKAKISEYKTLNERLKAFDASMGNHQRNVGNYPKLIGAATAELKAMALSYVSITAILAGVRTLINTNAEISDSLSDVQRTAGLTASEAENLAEQLKKIDTRTSLKGLLEISMIGGQLGIAKDQLAGFTKAVDQLAVSLGGELQGGAQGIAKSLGVLDNVFKVTASNGGDVEKSFNQIGSAILGLGQSGLATGDYLADFGERVGGIAKQAGLSLPKVLAYGAVLQENGVSAEVAGTSFKKLISALSTNTKGFLAVAQLGDAKLTLREFTDLINNDVQGALNKFFVGLQKGGGTTTEFMGILKNLKLSQSGVSQSIAALSSGQESLNKHIQDASTDFNNATLSAEQYAIKNDNLAGSVDKLGNEFVKVTTSGAIANFFKAIIDGARSSIILIGKLAESISNTRYDNAIKVYTKNKAKFGSEENMPFLTTMTGNPLISEVDVKAEIARRKQISDQEKINELVKIGIRQGKDIIVDNKVTGESLTSLAREEVKLASLRAARSNEDAKGNKKNVAEIEKINGQLIKQREIVGVLRAEYSKDTIKKIAALPGETESEQKKRETAAKRISDAAKRARERELKEAETFYTSMSKLEMDSYGGTLSAREKEEYDLNKNFIDRLHREQNNASDVERIKAAHYNTISSLQAKFDVDDKTKREKQIEEAVKAAQTYEQRLLEINKEYSDKAKLVREEAAKKGINPDAQIAILNQKWQAELEGEKQIAYQKTEIYRQQVGQVLDITNQQVRDQLAALKPLLENKDIPKDVKAKIEKEIGGLELSLKIGIDQNNLNIINEQIELIQKKLGAKDADGNSIITEEEFVRLENGLNELIKKRRELDKNGDGKVSWIDGLITNFDYLRGTTSQVFAGVSKDLGQLSGGFNELSNALGGVNTKAGYTLDTIGQLVGVASEAAGAAASFASGDIIGGVTKTIKAVTGIFSIGKKVKEMNAAARKEVEDFYNNAVAGEKAYQDLLKERELQTIRQNKLVLQGLKDELTLRKSQTADFAKETAEIMAKLQGKEYVSDVKYTHGTWFRKAETKNVMSSLSGKTYTELSQLLAQGKLLGDTKALVERLQELEQKGYDAAQAMADLAKETNTLFTGTTADDLTNSLANMFKEGKTEVQDFTEFFEESMEDAALNIFKNNILAKMMEKFYTEFAEAATSGDELTMSEIDILRSAFKKMSSDAQKEFEKLKQASGLFPAITVPINIDAGAKELGDNLFSLLTKSAKETGEGIEEILREHILAGLKAEIITNALKPLADKVKALYANGKIPTKAEIAELTAEMNVFIEGAREQLNDLEKATGLNLRGAIDSIDSELKSLSDSIIDAFSNLETGYENFAQKFDDIVKNKILGGLQNDFLQSRLTEFYTEFNKLDKVEDAKKAEQLALLKAQYNKIIKDGQAEYERLQDLFGVTLNVPIQDQGAISSSIGRSITEDTANVLSGTFLGIYEETKKSANWMGKIYDIATQNLNVAVRIEVNTRGTKENTDGVRDLLNTIERNTRPKAGSSLADNYFKL